MAKGIIYIMTTVVPGLVKIGKTGSANFEQRMYNLEHDGYRNVTGLKREFAIEVDGYSEKESLLHTIFEKSRVSDTELFAFPLQLPGNCPRGMLLLYSRDESFPQKCAVSV